MSSAPCWLHTLGRSLQAIGSPPDRHPSPCTRNLFAPLQGHCGHGCSVPGARAHNECIVCMAMRVRSIHPRMLDLAVVSASDCIRTTRATRTHRNRVHHSPDICLFRQACHNPILRDRATKNTPAGLLQQYFNKGETVSSPSCPLVGMPLANSSWVLPRGDEDWLAKGFGTELYTLPLDGSGVVLGCLGLLSRSRPSMRSPLASCDATCP